MDNRQLLDEKANQSLAENQLHKENNKSGLDKIDSHYDNIKSCLATLKNISKTLKKNKEIEALLKGQLEQKHNDADTLLLARCALLQGQLELITGNKKDALFFLGYAKKLFVQLKQDEPLIETRTFLALIDCTRGKN